MSKELLILFFTTFLFLVGCNETSNQKRFHGSKYKLSKEEVSLLRSGDIILRQGQGYVSNLIIKALNEDLPISHVGIITANENDDFFVIHSVSSTLSEIDGIQMQSLERFIKESVPNSVVIVRHVSSENKPSFGFEVAKRANKFLEQKIPFDHSFSYQDTTRFFCTELIWRVFKEAYDEEIFSISSDQSFINKMRFYHFFDTEKFLTILNHQIKN